MLSMIGSLLSIIPGFISLASTWVTKSYDAKVEMVKARIGGDTATAKELVTAAAIQEHENTNKLAIVSSTKVLLYILVGLIGPFIVFEWKVVVWDNVLQYYTHGNTDSIHGQVADWATTVIGFVCGSSTVMGLGHMYFNRNKTGE